MKIKEYEPLSNHISYKVGGNAKYFAEPETNEELIQLLNWRKEKKLVFYIIGCGTNVLFSDDEFDGIVISLKKLNRFIEVYGSYVIAGAGILLDELIDFSISQKLMGMENLSGIPGCIGGNIFMNAGAFDLEMKDIVDSVELLDKNNSIITMKNSEIGFSYRKTDNIENKIILSAKFNLNYSDNADDIREKRNKILKKREEKQPLNFPSCGSVFKRPKNNYAGALIEKCGLKGLSIGGAKVSEIHANFIINTGDATAQDIFDLINTVKSIVLKETGILLEEEVKLIGF